MGSASRTDCECSGEPGEENFDLGEKPLYTIQTF